MARKNDVVSLFLLFLLPRAAAQATDPAAPPSPEYNLGPVFNPTMAIVMIILVSAFFSLGFFSVYIRRCAGGRFAAAGASDDEPLFGENRRSWRAARGVRAEVIETFPTFKYSAVKGVKIGKGSLECAVCLNEFEDHETLRLMPRCCHVFHADCIDAWLSSHGTCPVCRADLTHKPGENLNPAAAPVQILVSPGEPGREPVFRSPEGNSVADQSISRPPRTRSTGLRFGGLFPRSHSTGHSLVQPGENCERFTLRLPKDVRSRIANSSVNLNRTRSLTVLPRARSERKGYRSGSVGSTSSGPQERFDRAYRWGLGMVRPSILRTGSVRSVNGGEEARTVHRSLLQSFRDPVNRLFLGSDNIGERSSDRLRSEV